MATVRSCDREAAMRYLYLENGPEMDACAACAKWVSGGGAAVCPDAAMSNADEHAKAFSAHREAAEARVMTYLRRPDVDIAQALEGNAIERGEHHEG